jgi:hypothetical protein
VEGAGDRDGPADVSAIAPVRAAVRVKNDNAPRALEALARKFLGRRARAPKDRARRALGLKVRVRRVRGQGGKKGVAPVRSGSRELLAVVRNVPDTTLRRPPPPIMNRAISARDFLTRARTFSLRMTAARRKRPSTCRGTSLKLRRICRAVGNRKRAMRHRLRTRERGASDRLADVGVAGARDRAEDDDRKDPSRRRT